YVVGLTRNEMGGSHYHLVHGLSGGSVPRVDHELAPRLFRRVHEAITAGLVRSCHDLSEGGLAAAVAEMAFAGGLGAGLAALGAAEERLPDEALLFAESATRFVVEVRPEHEADFEAALEDMPRMKLGQTVQEPRLRVVGSAGEWVVWAPLAQLK